MEGNAPRIHYLCNGNQEGCKKESCYKTNTDSELSVCRHTPDVRYAVNFSKLPYEKSAYWEGLQQGDKNGAADTKKQESAQYVAAQEAPQQFIKRAASEEAWDSGESHAKEMIIDGEKISEAVQKAIHGTIPKNAASSKSYKQK